MEDKDLLIEWAKRLQSLAQAGLTYKERKRERHCMGKWLHYAYFDHRFR